MRRRFIIAMIITLSFFIIIFGVALMAGRYSISLRSFFSAVFSKDNAYSMERSIILKLRLSRTIMAALTGIGISLSGLLFQELFQNKLVSPDLLGVSHGAGVGAALGIVLGMSSVMISLFAFGIGIATVFLTVLVSKIFRNKSSTMLLLAGVIVGGLMKSILSMIKYFANPETQLSDITYWLMGSFANATMKEDYILGGVVGVCLIVLIAISWRLNLLSLGRKEACSKGLNYPFYRMLVIVIATVLTATSVSFSGTISWIGLVVPHIVRLIVGKNTVRTIPLTASLGAGFMVLVDILSRTFTAAEIPLSAVTGLFGTILFVSLLLINRRNYHAA